MISYFEAAVQSASGLNQTVEFGDTAVGLYSRVNDPDTVVLYIPGGVKPLGLATGTTLQPNGFTWRWLPLWLQRGVVMAVVDMPKFFYDSEMPPANRQLESRIETLLEIIQYLRSRFPDAQLIGYGHSYGSLEMSLLSNRAESLDGIVIGSGNWNPDPDSSHRDANIYVNDFDPSAVEVPLLIVHHINDLTSKCRYEDAWAVMSKVDSITVAGGIPHLGDPGLDPGPHFFHLQENEVVKHILLWARNKIYSKFIL